MKDHDTFEYERIHESQNQLFNPYRNQALSEKWNAYKNIFCYLKDKTFFVCQRAKI